MVVASVIAPPLVRLTGQESRLRVRFSEPVPAWWRIGSGRCRDAGAMSVGLTAAATTCAARMGDGGTVIGGSFYRVGPDITPYGPLDDHEVLLVVVSAFASPESAPPWAPTVGDELGLFTVTIDRRSTVEAGSCEGCSACAWLRLSRIWLTQPVGVGDVFYEDILDSASSVVAQGMLLSSDGAYCPGTPAGRSTWGQVKSQYR